MKRILLLTTLLLGFLFMVSENANATPCGDGACTYMPSAAGENLITPAILIQIPGTSCFDTVYAKHRQEICPPLFAPKDVIWIDKIMVGTGCSTVPTDTILKYAIRETIYWAGLRGYLTGEFQLFTCYDNSFLPNLEQGICTGCCTGDYNLTFGEFQHTTSISYYVSQFLFNGGSCGLDPKCIPTCNNELMPQTGDYLSGPTIPSLCRGDCPGVGWDNGTRITFSNPVNSETCISYYRTRTCNGNLEVDVNQIVMNNPPTDNYNNNRDIIIAALKAALHDKLSGMSSGTIIARIPSCWGRAYRNYLQACDSSCCYALYSYSQNGTNHDFTMVGSVEGSGVTCISGCDNYCSDVLDALDRITFKMGQHEDINLINPVQILPNPSTGSTKMLLNNFSHGKASIKIFNNLGSLILESSADIHSDYEEYNFDMSKYPSGIYIFKIVQEGSVKSSGQFVIKK